MLANQHVQRLNEPVLDEVGELIPNSEGKCLCQVKHVWTNHEVGAKIKEEWPHICRAGILTAIEKHSKLVWCF
jgi:hypothetical protein